MPVSADRIPFTYAVLRLVPSVERGERINVGVVLFCRQGGGFLGVRTAVDDRKLAALAPGADPAQVRAALVAIERVVAGDREAGALGTLDPSERFGWVVAPSSTIIEPGPVHTGLCDDPAAELKGLFERLVV